MNSDMSQTQLSPPDYLAHISDEIDKITVGHPDRKNKFCKHIQRLIQEAENYGKYLRSQWQKAEKAGLTICDENKNKKKWSWWTALSKDFGWGPCVYFNDDEFLGVQFYIKGKPEPDPLGYLASMISGCTDQKYKGLELLDYQFTLLAMIHDAQSWQAGRDPIYFNRHNREGLKDRLCDAVWTRLEKYNNSYYFRDVQQTIETAMLAVRANLASGKAEERKEGPPERKSDLPPVQNTNITQNFQNIQGPVQGAYVQTGNHTSINNHPGVERNKKPLVRKVLGSIAVVVGFFAALLTCLYYLGWLEPIKLFIYKLFTHTG